MKKRVFGLAILVCVLCFLGVPPVSFSQEDKEETATTDAVKQGDKDATEADVVEQGDESVNLDPVVVTATRRKTELSKTTKSISVLTAEERDESEDYYLPKLLGDLPGVFYRSNGGPGQYSTLSIRGAGSQYTQFRYNGFPLRDTADTSGTMSYFVEDLNSTGTLDRVEVLRGTQSTLYGSQAMGGVVNIIPQKWNQGFTGMVRGEGGKYGTFNGTGKVAYGDDRFYVNFSPLYITTDGAKNGGQYGYYYEDLGFTGGAGVKFGPDMSLEFTTMLSDADLALGTTPKLGANGQPTVNVAVDGEHRESLMGQYGLTFSQDVNSIWTYDVRGAYTQTERHYFWSHVSGDQSKYDGNNTYLETQHNISATDWLTVVAGLDYEKSNYEGKEPQNPYSGDYTPVNFDHDWYLWDLFCEGDFAFFDDSLLFSLGGRLNDHQKFDTKTVGEASAAYIFKQTGTKIRGSIGTGYRTPSLYEMYGGYLSNGQVITVGNENLVPETSTSYEIGVDQEFLDRRVTLGATAFRIDFDDLIIYDGFTQKYDNASKAKTQGVEAYVNLLPCRWFGMTFSYTYADSQYKDYNSDEWMQKEYLPPHKVNATFSFYPIEGLTAWFRVAWRDEQIVPLYDSSYNKVRWEEPGVTTVDAAVSYMLVKNCEVWLRVENLFNKDYTESGYTMPGAWLYGGVKIRF